ncbi:hypothetical protein BGZ94_004082 [Podila epigama]|nr:hypothetical protein BGZ94_004082 [Podila epigama]
MDGDGPHGKVSETLGLSKKDTLETQINSVKWQKGYVAVTSDKYLEESIRKVYRKADRKGGSENARKEVKKRVEEEDTPLRELYEYAIKLPKVCEPVSEADQTGTFVLGMLQPIYNWPDLSRLANTACGALAQFEDDAHDWLIVCRAFDNLVATLKSAKERKAGMPLPPVFIGLSTPRSRHMKKDTKRNA